MSEIEKNNEELARAVSDQVVEQIRKELPKHTFSRKYNIFKDFVSLVLIAALVLGGYNWYRQYKRDTSILKSVEGYDLTLDNNGILGYTAVDFADVIVGSSTRQSLLIVDEQELSAPTVVTQAGLFKLGIFSKNQSVVYNGTAQYTVDISKITSDKIEVDAANHTITITVPYPELHDVIFNPENTVFGDTEKGLLAFFDIKMSLEDSNTIAAEAVKKLREKALDEKCLDKAVDYGRYVLRDFYETAIEAITKSYKVKIVFDEPAAPSEPVSEPAAETQP
ncbi:MAG: DUF4230 domain-containing protein [Erysipelotrichaceae bacterium]|nr:DUF4230 domain-containing protein [Erysipelotrichaceae bacterium]